MKTATTELLSHRFVNMSTTKLNLLEHWYSYHMIHISDGIGTLLHVWPDRVEFMGFSLGPTENSFIFLWVFDIHVPSNFWMWGDSKLFELKSGFKVF
jgi:hypothetical protein